MAPAPSISTTKLFLRETIFEQKLSNNLSFQGPTLTTRKSIQKNSTKNFPPACFQGLSWNIKGPRKRSEKKSGCACVIMYFVWVFCISYFVFIVFHMIAANGDPTNEPLWGSKMENQNSLRKWFFLASGQGSGQIICDDNNMRPCGAWPIRICVLTLHHRYNPSSASISNVAQPAPSEPYSSMTLSCGFWGLILGKMPNKRNCNWMFLLSLSLTELSGLLGLCAIKREALALRWLTAPVRQPGKPGNITQPLHTNKPNHTKPSHL